MPTTRPEVVLERIARAEEFFSYIPVTLRHSGNRVYYTQELDCVQVPIIEELTGPAVTLRSRSL